MKKYVELTPTPTPAAATIKITATVRKSVKVRTKAGSTSAQLKIDKKNVSSAKSDKVTITKEKRVDGEKWYYVTFKRNSKSYKGWVHGRYVKLTVSTKKAVTAAIRTTSVTMKKTAGPGAASFKVNGTTIKLTKGTLVTIVGESLKENVRYYKVIFEYKGNN